MDFSIKTNSKKKIILKLQFIADLPLGVNKKERLAESLF
jgi:hypothetical protein